MALLLKNHPDEIANQDIGFRYENAGLLWRVHCNTSNVRKHKAAQCLQ
jgi:hypothetical protein